MIDLSPFVQRELWLRRTLLAVIAVLAVGWGLTFSQVVSRSTEIREVLAGWGDCQSGVMARVDALEEARQQDLRGLFGDRQIEP